jgi:hypothetical protein
MNVENLKYFKKIQKECPEWSKTHVTFQRDKDYKGRYKIAKANIFSISALIYSYEAESRDLTLDYYLELQNSTLEKVDLKKSFK